MRKKHSIKLVREGEYLAEVEVELLYTDDAWSPTLSIEEARKLDTVRQALSREDIAAAAKLARIYKLTPIADEFSERAKRGSREKYEAALAQVPDVEPEDYDRIE